MKAKQQIRTYRQAITVPVWAVLAIVLALCGAVQAEDWDSDANAVNGATDGPGTWDLSTANWYDGVSSDVVWPNTTASIASIGATNGAAGTIAVSGTITLNALTLNTPGSGNYTLNGGTLSFGGTNPKITANTSVDATIASAITNTAALTVTNAGKVTLSGNTSIGNGVTTFNGGCLLRLTGSLTNYTASQTRITGGSTMVVDGGSLTLNYANARAIVVGSVANQVGTLIVTNGGMVTTTGASGSAAGGLYVGEDNAQSAGAVYQYGGTVTLIAGNSCYLSGSNSALTVSGGTFNGSNVRMGQGNGAVNSASTITVSGTGSINLLGLYMGNGSRNFTNVTVNVGTGSAGGTLTLNGGIFYGGPASYARPSTLNFNGGTLVANATWTNPDVGNYFTVVQSGGANINVVGANTLTIPTALTSGGGGGGLTKSGTGTLVLAGANSYSGTTVVGAGKLVVSAAQTGTGVVTNSANAALGVIASGVSQWQPTSLTLGNPSTLEFNSVTNAGTTTAPLAPSAAVSAVNVTVNVNSLAVVGAVGNSFPLMGNVTSTNGYTLSGQPPGYTGHLGINSSTLVYIVDGVDDIWTGADGTNPSWWDIGASANWTGKAATNTPANTYAQNDKVVFDDTASSSTVDIQAAMTPASVNFLNSSLAYTVNDAGGVIGGATALTKDGTAVVTLAGANTYTGNTTIKAGTLALSGSGSIDNSASINVAAGASLNVTNRFDYTLTVNANQTLTGSGLIRGMVVNNGTLVPGSSIGTLTISSNLTLGATSTNIFEVNGSTPTNDTVQVNGIASYDGVLTIVPTGSFTPGQSFKLFSGALTTSATTFASIVGSPGAGKSFSFTNGVLTVVGSGPSGPATLTNSVGGGTFSLSWPAGQGWRLQEQTNALSKGLSTNWVYVTDGSVSSTNITVDPSKGTVFYRLLYP